VQALDLLVEYDGEMASGGVRFTLLNHVQFLAALQNFDTFAGGMTLMARL